MKVYEKPRLIALPLSGNNRLCGDCAGKITLHNNESLAKAILMMVGRSESFDSVQGITRGDFQGLFGSIEDQCRSGQIVTYCKFTSTGEQVAWS